MRDLSWLTARPIAHRGFHDAARGCIENTRCAVAASIEKAYSIEVDLQQSADDKAIVFHDDTLDRLTFETGPVKAVTAARLKAAVMRGTDDRLWLLDELLELVDGRVGLCIEIKSRFERHPKQAYIAGIAESLKRYRGPVAVKSFDPDVLQMMREAAPDIPRGALCDGAGDIAEWGRASRVERFMLRHMLYAPRVRPSFVSYWVKGLPAVAPALLRKVFGLPLIAWTIRTPEDRARADAFADQIVFEGFDPDKTG